MPFTDLYADAINDFQRKTFVVVGPNGYPDFITDGNSDEEQIQDAVDQVGQAGGGVIYIKPGRYNFQNSGVYIPYDKVTIIASGGGHYGFATNISASGVIPYMFKFSCNYPGGIRDVLIDGNSLATDLIQIGKDTIKMKGTNFTNLRLQNALGYGIKGVGAQSMPFDDMHVFNLRIANCDVGMMIGGTQTALFGCTIGGCRLGIDQIISTNFNLFNCTFADNQVDISLSSDNYVSGSALYGCWFEGATTAIFKRTNLSPLYKYIGGMVFSNCKFQNQVGTSNYVVSSGDVGKTFIGTTNNINFTLPKAIPGLTYSFTVGTSGKSITLTRNGTDTIAGANTISNTGTLYDNITIQALNSTTWIIKSTKGTWS